MVRTVVGSNIGPQLFTAVRYISGLIFALVTFAPLDAASAQQKLSIQQQPVSAQKMDEITANKLVWSSVAALDQANRTGNYSVLRDLGAPSFQANNSPTTLAGVFERLRNAHIDLANTFVVTPVYTSAPSVQGDVLRTKGVFPLRPTAIGFDLLFQQVAGEWRILGISVVPLVRTSPQPNR